MHKVNVIPIKLSITFFTDLQKKNHNFCGNTEDWNSQSNLDKQKQVETSTYMTSSYTTKLQSSRQYGSDQFSSVQLLSSVRLCDAMDYSTPGLPVHHQLPQFTQTHVHQVRDTIQPSHPLSSPSPPVPNPSQHQSLFQ